MQQKLDLTIASHYSSQTQKIRVMTEAWLEQNIFCPNCGELSVTEYPNNKPVADFYCSQCDEDFELKSKKNNLGTKIVDGAYTTMIERLNSSRNPNFFLLTYNHESYEIKDFLVVPKHFFTPNVIEKRKPLAQTAKRAGWIGCNISLKEIPDSGKIFYVKNGAPITRNSILKTWKKTLFLRETKQVDAKGWLLDTLKCIDKINKDEFSLDEIYTFEQYLKKSIQITTLSKISYVSSYRFFVTMDFLNLKVGDGINLNKLTEV